MLNKQSAQNLDEFSKALSGTEGIKWSDYEKIQNIKKEDISKTKTDIDNEINRIQSLPPDQRTDLGSWKGYRESIDTIETKWKEGTLTITQHKEESHDQTIVKTKAKLVEFFGIKPVAPARVDAPAKATSTTLDTPAPAATTLDAITHKTDNSALKSEPAEIIMSSPQEAITIINRTFADKNFDMKNFGKSFEKSCETVEFYNAVATLVRLDLIQDVDQCTQINIRKLRAATQTLQKYFGITEDGAFGPETLRAYQNSKNTKDLKEFLALTPAQKIAKGFHSIKKNTVVSAKQATAQASNAPAQASKTPVSAPVATTKQTPAYVPEAKVSAPVSAPAQARPTPAQAPTVSAPTKPATVSAPAQTTNVPTSAPVAVASASVASASVKQVPAPASASAASTPEITPKKSSTPEVLPKGLSKISDTKFQDTDFTYTLSEKTCTIIKYSKSKEDIIINGDQINLREPIKAYLLSRGIQTVTTKKNEQLYTFSIKPV